VVLSQAGKCSIHGDYDPDNHTPMDALDQHGEPRHWILEIHLLDPTGQFGGFYEDTLNP
jgi:hypothetical protein